MLGQGLGVGFRVFSGNYNSFPPRLKYLRPPTTNIYYFKRRILSIYWKPIPIGTEATLFEIKVVEPSISVSDTTQVILRRVRDVAEPSISVSDIAAMGVFKSVSITEPAISVSDAVNYLLRRDRQVSEPSISVGDIAALVLRRDIQISEPAISMSDGVIAEKITVAIERSVTEILGTLIDTVDFVKFILPWLTGVFEDQSEVTVIGCQSPTTVIAAQSVADIRGAAVKGNVE